MQTDAQVLIFLFYTSVCTMHGSIIRPDPIPEKTNYCFKDTNFMFGPTYKLSKFHVICVNDSSAYQNLQRKGQYKSRRAH